MSSKFNSVRICFIQYDTKPLVAFWRLSVSRIMMVCCALQVSDKVYQNKNLTYHLILFLNIIILSCSALFLLFQMSLQSPENILVNNATLFLSYFSWWTKSGRATRWYNEEELSVFLTFVWWLYILIIAIPELWIQTFLCTKDTCICGYLTDCTFNSVRRKLFLSDCSWTMRCFFCIIIILKGWKQFPFFVSFQSDIYVLMI